MPFGILLHLKIIFTSEPAPVKSCEVKEGPCGFNLKQIEEQKWLIYFLQGGLLQKLVGVQCEKRPIQAQVLFCVATMSLTQQLLDCGLKKLTVYSCYQLPNHAKLFTYWEEQHRHREYHRNDHSQAHHQDEDVIFALVLVKQIRLHFVYGKDSKISVLANRQLVHKKSLLNSSLLEQQVIYLQTKEYGMKQPWIQTALWTKS